MCRAKLKQALLNNLTVNNAAKHHQTVRGDGDTESGNRQRSGVMSSGSALSEVESRGAEEPGEPGRRQSILIY